jgi:exopolyphosphatase/guanosine-5'-triphosphate,3'-diphosphate pyrophosphatase
MIRLVPDKPHLFQAIDIGSNAVRVRTWSLRPSDDGGDGVTTDLAAYRRHPLRLGASVFATGRLSDATIEALAEILRPSGRDLAEGRLAAVWAVGTSALREAANAPEACRRWREVADIETRVLTGDQEARLIALGVLGRHGQAGRLHVILDVGGGSSELILTRGPEVVHAQSFPIGAVRLRRQSFEDADPPTPAQIAQARACIHAAIDAGWLASGLPDALEGIGLAGTATTLWRMANGAPEVPPEGGMLDREQVNGLIEAMAPLTAAQILARWPSIEPDRTEVILAGALILEAFIARLGLARLRVVMSGVSDGLLQSYLAQIAADGQK